MQVAAGSLDQICKQTLRFTAVMYERPQPCQPHAAHADQVQVWRVWNRIYSNNKWMENVNNQESQFIMEWLSLFRQQEVQGTKLLQSKCFCAEKKIFWYENVPQTENGPKKEPHGKCVRMGKVSGQGVGDPFRWCQDFENTW